MSRIGLKPIQIIENVTLDLSPTMAVFKGPLGTLSVNIPHGIKVSQKDKVINVTRVSESKPYRSLHGTVAKLISNSIEGVTKGFQKKLELIGIGYRGTVEGTILNLQVGYTHPVVFEIPEGLEAKFEKNVLTITGADKQKVGEFAATVRKTRKPEPYKARGFVIVVSTADKNRGKQGRGQAKMTKIRNIKSPAKIKEDNPRPRLSVYRSLTNIFAQIIDDTTGTTLVSASSLKISGNLMKKSEIVGRELAILALDKKIKKIVFDRNGFAYHGAVKSLANAARQAGLEF